MTFDQFAHLLAVLAWPVVAIIAGVAAVHCCRLLTEVLADESEHWRKSSFELALLVEERRSRSALLVAQASRPEDVFDIFDGKTGLVADMAKTTLLTLLAANGGLPGSPNDDAVRQIVREVRKLYEEVDKPTPETQVAKEALRAPNAGDDADDLTLDELFGPEVVDVDEEEMEL